MSDEKKKKIIEQVKRNEKEKYTEGINFERCPIHGMSYPKGGQCPQCRQGKNK